MSLAITITHASMAATALVFGCAGVYLVCDGSRRSGPMLLLIAALQAIGAAMWFFR